MISQPLSTPCTPRAARLQQHLMTKADGILSPNCTAHEPGDKSPRPGETLSPNCVTCFIMQSPSHRGTWSTSWLQDCSLSNLQTAVWDTGWDPESCQVWDFQPWPCMGPHGWEHHQQKGRPAAGTCFLLMEGSPGLDSSSTGNMV